ncbi:MAG: hypothetical protein AAGH76_17770 [Pseudomonadota bacterium]
MPSRWFAQVLTVSAILALLSGCIERPIRDGDRHFVVTAAALEPYGYEMPDDVARYESLKRTRWFDNTEELEYEYNATGMAGLPYVYSLTEWHPSKTDACTSYAAGNIGVGLGGSAIESLDDEFSYGDKSQYGLMTDDGEVYGIYFAMCHDKQAFMLMLTGVVFDNGDQFARFIEPVLANIEARRNVVPD